MLVCPQCQVANPDSHKFCQGCGASLIDKSCPQCGNRVSFSSESCSNCGTFTGTVWWAIIAHIAASQSESKSKKEDVTLLQVSSDEYLDQEKRYRIRSLVPVAVLPELESNSSHQWFQGQVLDSQPLEKSIRQMSMRQQLAQNLGSLPDKQLEIAKPPAIAQPYLSLQFLCPAIPQIHDTWQEDTKQVLLLSDLSSLPLLSQVWGHQQLSQEQILTWLDEMARLWEVLGELGCAQSLLVEDNLRVIADRSICLQQLYSDSPDLDLTLQDLAQLWKWLFSQSGKTELGLLAQLLREITDGELKTVAQLRSRLATLAQEQQFPEGEQAVRLLDLSDAGGTEVGHRRDHNEDYFGIETEILTQKHPQGQISRAQGLYIVCDGMGGHAAGEIASQIAVQELQEYFHAHWYGELPEVNTIREGILCTNQILYEENKQKARSGRERMGTTLVMALVQDTQVAIAHVGDSRIYRITQQRGLEQLSTDHEIGQREIAKGIDPEVAYGDPLAYQLTQALGPRNDKSVHPDIQFLEISQDTLLLLCSDGLSDRHFIDKYWQNLLVPLLDPQANLEDGLIQLMEFADQYNGHDNITGILIRILIQAGSQ